MPLLETILSRRVLFVLGKGGVGKSVVSGAIALLAARRGRRVCVAEVNGSETMAALFDRPPVGYAGAEVAPGLHAMSITAHDSVEEYLVRTLRFRMLYDLVFRNKMVEPFMSAVMGLGDLITVGKVMDLEWERVDGSHGPGAKGPHRFDLVVVDCPATGHGLSLLRAPQAMMDVTRTGPLHQNAELVRDLVSDSRRTGAVFVTLPESLPITETLEAVAAIRSGFAVDLLGVVANAVPPAVFPDSDAAACWPEVRAESLALGGVAAGLAASVDRALRDRERALLQMERLRAGSTLPVLELPLLPRRDLDAAALQELGLAFGAGS
jgi:anion-transporting  ArsA/GET3 family ATPase